MEFKYPKPDRSSYVPSPMEPDEDGVIDVGFRTGTFADGREYRLECWRMEEMVMVTVMFSDIELEDSSREDLRELLVKERILTFKQREHPLQCTRTFDDSGRAMWSVNIMLSDHKGKYCEIVGSIRRYGQIFLRGDSSRRVL